MGRIRRSALLVLVVALSLHSTSALPDFLAPFRSMLGKKGSPSSSYPKPLSSPKDPSIPSHISHSPESENPFEHASNFGGFGGGGKPVSGGPSALSRFPRYPSSSHSSSPFPSSYSSSPFGGRPSSSRPSRPVRQQPGGFSYRPGQFGGSGGFPPSPSSSSGKDHHPQPHGPPSQFRGPGHEDNNPYKYSEHGLPPSGGSPSGNGGPYSSAPFSSSGSRGPPPSFGQGRPFPYSPSSSPGNHNEGGDESGPQGPGFTGFGSFPNSGDEDDAPSSGPRGPPPSFSSFPISDDKPYSGGPSGGRPFEGSPSFSGPEGQDDESNGPSSSPYFGGVSNYPEQYEGGPRGTRGQPQIISGAGFPSSSPNEEEYDGPREASPFSGGFPSHSQQSGPPPSWAQQGDNDGGRPSYSSFGPSGVEAEPPSSTSSSRPMYKPRKRRPSKAAGNNPFSSPASPAGFPHYHNQQPAESRQPPVTMLKPTSTTTRSTSTGPLPPQIVGQKKRYSAKIPGVAPPPRPRVIPLESPRDPNYQESNVHEVAAAFEPETSASGHGHHGHGGGGFDEGLSSNGDRILYHVAGHQGPYSYRFGYDTGKGYNRLFRFEEKDGKGYVKGKYGFYDKHGKLQVINYEAHPKHGFHAERAHPHH